MQVVRVVVAGDAVTLDQRLREVERLDRKIEYPSGILWPQLRGQFMLAHGKSKDCLAATASRGAVPHGVRLDYRDSIAALRQVQRSGASRKAATDDSYVGALFALEAGSVGRRPAGAACTGGVIGAGGWVKQAQGVTRFLAKCLRFYAY